MRHKVTRIGQDGVPRRQAFARELAAIVRRVADVLRQSALHKITDGLAERGEFGLRVHGGLSCWASGAQLVPEGPLGDSRAVHFRGTIVNAKRPQGA